MGMGILDDDAATARAWLESFDAVPHVSEAVLDELEANQKSDRPPSDLPLVTRNNNEFNLCPASVF